MARAALARHELSRRFTPGFAVIPNRTRKGYSPDVLLKEGNNLRLNPPSSDFGEVKQLPWLWWGVRWSEPGIPKIAVKLSTCALVDGLHHLNPHRDALLDRKRKFKTAAKAATEVGSAAAELVSLGIVGAGKSVLELLELWREERHMQGQEKLTVEERQAAALQKQIDGLHEFMRSMLEPSAVNPGGLPIILVLDDAQWIDLRSLEVVNRLLLGASRHRWPLMLIVTHWEQDWNLQAQDSTHNSFPALYTRLAADSSQGKDTLSLELRDIDRLDGLEQLLREGLPGLTTEQVAFLCARADGNPRLMNEIILELRDEPSYFEDEDIGRPLSAEALAALSQKSFALHEVQKRRFRRLDDTLRKLLSYASYQGMRFLRELVLDVAQVLDAQHPPEEDAERLTCAVQPYAVLAAESAVIYEFRHRVFHDLARERIDRLPQLGRSLAKALLQVGSDWLDNSQLEPFAPAEREAFHLLMLDQLDLTNAAYPHLRLRLIVGLFRLYLETGHFAKALDWSDQLANELPADGRIATELVSLDDQIAIVDLWLKLERRELAEKLARGLVETCRAGLAQTAGNAKQLGDISVAELCLGDVMRRDDQPNEARALYEASLDTFERIMAVFGETAKLLSNVSVSQQKLGDMLVRADQPEKARELYEQSLATCERIVAEFGETAERLRNVSVSQISVGDVLLGADQPEQARTLYEASLATCERIVAEFGETAERLRDVSVSQIRVGDVLLGADQPAKARALYEASLATCERIVAEFGETAERLHNVSASQQRLGDMLVRADQPEKARELYEQSLATCERIVVEFGETAEGLRNAAVSQQRLGDVLVRADQPEKARELYEQSLANFERIVGEFGVTANRLRDVMLSQHRIGDVLVRANQPEKARALWEQSLATAERIMSEFGETAERLRDVTLSQVRVGNVLMRANQPEKARALWEQSLATAERIMSEFGETAERLRDIAILQYKLGKLARQNGDISVAREHLAASESLFARLVTQIGTNSAQAELESVRGLIVELASGQIACKALTAMTDARAAQEKDTKLVTESPSDVALEGELGC